METGSRRKQLRPARVDDERQQSLGTVLPHRRSTVTSPMNSSLSAADGRSTSAESPVFDGVVKFEVDDELRLEMMSGETRGPFPVKELRASNSEAENAIMLVDQMGNKHCFDVDSSDPLIKRIKPCPNALEANCIIFHHGFYVRLLQKYSRKIVIAINNVRTKYMKCGYEGVYIVKTWQLTIAAVAGVPSNLVPSIHHGTSVVPPQNVILMPIAYHDHRHEIVQRSYFVPKYFSLAFKRRSEQGLYFIRLRNPNEASHAIIGILAGLKRTVERPVSTPLDLSKKRREDDSGSSGTATPTNAIRASHSDVEKPFLCACGISFSADETLKAHRQYYCKMVERRDDNKDPPKKVKTRCSQCEYEPGSLSQLSVHVRTVHNEVQAYVCRLCGYRGFSLRGIRSHMRSHSELDAMKFEFLLANHIAKVKTERKSPDNQETMEQE
uniref:C2H2-type domain-containing protein n=1 Tax=Angiostrongylus cantonensis TaxID=6313 RepID=A0A158PAZ5_ANGCA